MGIICYLIYTHRQKNKNKYVRPAPSYDNPVYSTSPNDRPSLYTDVPENPVSSLLPNDDSGSYLDVNPYEEQGYMEKQESNI